MDELCRQCYLPDSPSQQEKTLALVNSLAQIVPLWEMEGTKDVGAALASYEAMSGVL